MAIASPFLLNGVGKVSTIWFADNERALALAVGALSQPFGAIIGLGAPIALVKTITKEDCVADCYTKEDARTDIGKYMFYLAVANSVFGILLLVSYRLRPAKFPSSLAEKIMTSKTKFNFMRDLKLLLNNKNYLTLMVPFVINYSVHHCLSAVLAFLLAPYDYTQNEGSAMGVGYIFLGLVGSIVFARQLDTNRNYLKVLKIVCFGALIPWTLAIWILPLGNVPVLAVGEMLAGFFTIPIIPVGY